MAPESPSFLESDSHRLPNLGALLDDVNAHHLRSSRGWLENGAEDHEQSGLSGTVRAQNYHNLAFVDCEVQLSKSIRLPILLRETDGFHCVQDEASRLRMSDKNVGMVYCVSWQRRVLLRISENDQFPIASSPRPYAVNRPVHCYASHLESFVEAAG